MTLYDLVCTGCNFKLTSKFEMNYHQKLIMRAGYCNRCPEKAKLEWRESK